MGNYLEYVQFRGLGIGTDSKTGSGDSEMGCTEEVRGNLDLKVIIRNLSQRNWGWREKRHKEMNFPIFMLFKLWLPTLTIELRCMKLQLNLTNFWGVHFNQSFGKIHCYPITVACVLKHEILTQNARLQKFYFYRWAFMCSKSRLPG